jgi:hypothetical protein
VLLGVGEHRVEEVLLVTDADGGWNAVLAHGRDLLAGTGSRFRKPTSE